MLHYRIIHIYLHTTISSKKKTCPLFTGHCPSIYWNIFNLIKQASTVQYRRVVTKKEHQMDGWHTINLEEMQQQQKMYRPPDHKDTLKLEHRERMRMHWSECLCDLFMFLAYIVTLYWVVLHTTDVMGFYSTKSIRDAIVNSDTFRDISSGKKFISYMSEVLIPALHQEEMYNHDGLTEAGVTAVFDTKLLGVVRLRQLRVKNGTCSVATEARDLHGRCGTEFSLRTEDKKNYGLSWSPFDADSLGATRKTGPWLYHTAWELGTSPVKGEFAWYPGGGYITTLGRTLENSLAAFEFLTHCNWLDQHTHAIFIDFTTYNANRNFFNVVNLMVEISAQGAVHSSQNIKTLKLLMNYHELGMSILVATVLCLLMLCVFMVRQMVQFGRISVRSYFSNWYNITDLIIVLLGITTVGFFFLRSKYVSTLIKHLEETDDNEFVNFSWAAYWQMILRYFIAGLVGLSTIRLWKLLWFGRQFRAFEHILRVASHDLIPLTFVMLTVTIGFACVAYVLVGHTSYEFSKLYYSISTVFFYGIGVGELDHEKFFSVDQFIGPIFIIIYWLAFIIFLLNMFITVINLGYEISQEELNLVHEEYTVKDFLMEVIEYHFTCVYVRIRSRQRVYQNSELQN